MSDASNAIGTLIVDIDGTLCPLRSAGDDYYDLIPFPEIVQKLREYQGKGFWIVLFTARQMRTYGGSVGRINKHVIPRLVGWLEHHEVPFDEILVGKPWPGERGIYIDDRTVRPDEFLAMDFDDIERLLDRSRIA